MSLDQYAVLLARLNEKKGRDLHKIILLPGMDFGDIAKWWAAAETRSRPHEGVDVVCFVDGKGISHFLGEGIKVPCLTAGEVVAICDDFLGESVFVRGESSSLGDIVVVHAHIVPGVSRGELVAAGEEIGRIAPAGGAVPAHLHLSLFRFSPFIPWADIDWRYLNECDPGLLLNPFP